MSRTGNSLQLIQLWERIEPRRTTNGNSNSIIFLVLHISNDIVRPVTRPWPTSESFSPKVRLIATAISWLFIQGRTFPCKIEQFSTNPLVGVLTNTSLVGIIYWPSRSWHRKSLSVEYMIVYVWSMIWILICSVYNQGQLKSIHTTLRYPVPCYFGVRSCI